MTDAFFRFNTADQDKKLDAEVIERDGIQYLRLRVMAIDGGVVAHNDLAGLNLGDYLHLTADEKLTFDGLDGRVTALETQGIPVGSATTFYLDATAFLADNQVLATSPSNYPEEVDTVAVDSGTNDGVGFLERFVSSPLGRTSIPAGSWAFTTFANISANQGISKVTTRINKRVLQTGMTGTFTGTGPTRTFTVTGGTPFVPGDATASILTASLIETPTQTAWISGYTSSSVVTVTLTDPAFVNASNVELTALYYLLFSIDSPELDTATAGQRYDYQTTQPAFTGLNLTDRLIAAYFGVTDSASAKTVSLYHGGTARYSHFVAPLLQRHNDLLGLNEGDYIHLTAAEKTALDNLPGDLAGHDHSGGDGALIPAAGLDTDNSAADGDLMSYSGITGKLSWLKSVTYQPSGGTAVTGTVTAGTYADAQVRGGVAWTIQEVTGVPGFNVQLTFSNVENFNEIRAYMRYQGGGSHLCEVGLKDGDAATFTTLTSFNSQNGLTDVIIQVDNGPSYIATDGSVTVRFYHPITGNGTTHFLHLDMVNLLLAVTGGGGVTDHRALSNRLDAEAHPASAITVSSSANLAATDVQAALLELNTEKIEGSGVAKITVGTSTPAAPAVGDLWIDTN
jgi:hypothetical protein